MADACYKPKYLNGSYKGVSFKVEEAGSEHGRRGAIGEFPFGETTAYADLGRKNRSYSISARFDGNDHILQAAALIAVCELPGSGPLVHPTRGVILSAACTKLSVSDKVETEQGVTYVTMEFVEANNWPNGLSLIGQLLGLVLAPLLSASSTSFKSSYAPSTIQPYRLAPVLAKTQAQVTFIQQRYELATTSKATDQSRNRIANDLNRIATDNGLTSDPDTADDGISLGITAIAQATVGAAKFEAMRAIANNASKTSTFSAPASTAENAVYAHIRITAAGYMAEAVLEMDTARADEIFTRADILDDLLAQELVYARASCNNELFLQISKFRTEAKTKIYSKAYKSPGLITYDFNGRVHPLVAAYSIYNDAKRHRELENLNQVGTGGRFGNLVTATSTVV